MAKLNKTRTIAAALLGTAVLGAPITSFAQDFKTGSRSFAECKIDDKNNQVIGGLIGAVAGGVFGSQVSGNGARTEGSILGAALGAAAGAGIADDRRNCTTEARRGGFDTGFNTRATTVRVANNGFRNRGFNNRSRGFNNRRFNNNRGFNNNGFNRRNVSYGHNNRIERRLYIIDKEIHAANIKIDELKYKEDILKDKRRYAHDTYRIDKKLRAIDREIHFLKDCKRELKREARHLRKKQY